MKFLILLVISFNGISSVFHAQNKSQNSSLENPDQEFSSYYKRKYLQYTEGKNGLVIFQSILVRSSDSVVYNGKKSRAITQHYHMSNFIDTDSSICDPVTLLPLAYYSQLNSEGYNEEVIFTPKTILNKITFKDTVKSTTRINNSFMNGVVEDDLVSRLDFTKDTMFTLHVVNPGLLFTEYQIKVRVLGKELLEVAGYGKIPCWKLDINSGAKNGATAWYSEKNHIQFKKTFLLPDGNLFTRTLLFN